MTDENFSQIAVDRSVSSLNTGAWLYAYNTGAGVLDAVISVANFLTQVANYVITTIGTRYYQPLVVDFTTDVNTGDGAYYITIPTEFNGWNLTFVHARVITAGTTGTTDIQIHNVTDAVDMLSTKLTIDSTETGSNTAATPAVIDTTKDDVASYDLLRIDIDAVSTTKPKGLIVTLGFTRP